MTSSRNRVFGDGDGDGDGDGNGNGNGNGDRDLPAGRQAAGGWL